MRRGPAFQYWNRGSFAVVGRGAAVGIALGQRVAGYFAWVAWLAIHIAFLVGFRNCIAVLFNWAYVYFTGRRHAKLIVGQVPQPQPAPTHDSQAQHQPVPLGQPALSARPHPLSG